MDATIYSAPTQITDERIKAVEEKGRQAARECRSRAPTACTFSEIERKAYQRGWDEVRDLEAACFGPAS